MEASIKFRILFVASFLRCQLSENRTKRSKTAERVYFERSISKILLAVSLVGRTAPVVSLMMANMLEYKTMCVRTPNTQIILTAGISAGEGREFEKVQPLLNSTKRQKA